MARSTGSSDTLRRIVDDGSPLVLPVDGDLSRRLVVFSTICESPECDCKEVRLEAALVRASPGKRFVPDSDRRAFASLDVGTGRVVREEPPAGMEQDDEVLAMLEAALDDELMGFFVERRLRVKGREDHDQWRRQDRALLESDHMVPYCEAFPRDFDICVDVGGRRLLVLDLHCLQPGCTCREVTLTFDDTGTGETLGLVRVVPGRWRRAKLEGPPELRVAWKALLGQRGVKAMLEERASEMQRVGRELAAERASRPPSASVKLGRNAPCPCGSGKKYKRCCLPKAERKTR